MHILMATLQALDIPSDDVVLNRSCLRKIREENRQNRSDEAKSDIIDKVKYYLMSTYRFVLHT